jgi:hypothetical protein
VQPIKYKTPQIGLAFQELMKRTSIDDPKVVSDAQSLVTTLENFDFLVGIFIWNNVLFAIKNSEQKM